MLQVYVIYFIGCIAPLFLYKENKLAAKVGFGIASFASGYGVICFLTNLNSTKEIVFGKEFLFNPHFVLDPIGIFFSFVITLIALAASIYGIQYSQEYEKKGSLGVMAGLFNLFVLAMLLVISSANVFWFYDFLGTYDYCLILSNLF